MSQKNSLIIFTNQKPFGKQIDAFLEGTSYQIRGISDTFHEITTLLKHLVPDFLMINLYQSCVIPNIHQFKIASPRTRIIFCEEKCNSHNIFDLIQAGADSFIPIPISRDEILGTLNGLVNDEIFIPAFVASSILEKSREINPATHEFPFILTDRDRSILWCLAKGMSRDQIRISLGIEDDLIRAHMTNILQKIHFSDIVQNNITEKKNLVQNEIEHLELI